MKQDPESRPRPLPFAPSVVSDNWIFVSGQVPEDFGQGIEQQTTEVLKKIEKILANRGASVSDIVKTTVFLTKKGDFAGMNASFAAFFGGYLPARSTIVTELVVDALIEIEVIAIKR